MEYNKPKENEEAINERSPTYGVPAPGRLRIFNSFQEQEEEMISYWASITPRKRLEHLYEMIKTSFRISEEEARSVKRSKKLIIIKGSA